MIVYLKNFISLPVPNKKITKFVFIAVLEIPGRPIVNDDQKRLRTT
jgi:hypothetical protein